MTTDTRRDALALPYPVRRVGDGRAHEFFGYYNKTNWDHNGQLLLAHRVGAQTGDVDGTEPVMVGYFDLEDHDRFHVIGETTTWNWQMGAQLQWLPGLPGRKVIYNKRDDRKRASRAVNNGFVSTVVDIDKGETYQLDYPVYSVAPNSRWAVTVNYSRLLLAHQTIGYRQLGEEPEIDLAPSNDGLFQLDMHGGDARLILSLKELTEFHPRPSMARALHWISHAEINPSSSRILFLHRWTERVLDETCFLHRLITCNPDGSNPQLVECSDHPLPQLEQPFDPDATDIFEYEKSEFQISHPMWANDDLIVVWGPHSGVIGYRLYDDRTKETRLIGKGALNENGHMTLSHNGRLLLSDTYPDPYTNKRSLFLWDMERNQKLIIGEFQNDPRLGKHNRCDLHPRWSPDGKVICIDSIHEGTRGLYLIDIVNLIEKLNF